MKQLFYDIASCRYFKLEYGEFEKTIAKSNHLIILDGYMLLNELYDELGLETIPSANEVGWFHDLISYHAYFGYNGNQTCIAIKFDNLQSIDKWDPYF